MNVRMLLVFTWLFRANSENGQNFEFKLGLISGEF